MLTANAQLFTKYTLNNSSLSLSLSLTHSQEAIFRVVAAILHLGNIDFAKGEEADSSVLKDDKARFHLQTTSELLKYNQMIYSWFTIFNFLMFLLF